LEDTNPSVRYFALTDLAGIAEDDRAVLLTRKRIMTTQPVSRILRTQEEGGYWGNPEKFYLGAKWRGTFFTLILLADLGASGEDDRVRNACEFLLEHAQVKETGGFGHKSKPGGRGGMPGAEHPCMTGKMIWPLIRFGYLDDQRVQHSIQWIVKYQRFDDGGQKHPPEGWPYRWTSCWGRHTCFRGVVRNLKALAEIPRDRRSRGVQRTIEKAAEFILKHHICKRSHNLEELMKKEWTQFIFPQFGDIDALEVLLVLTKLGYRDPRMQSAVDLVVSKQDERGRWSLERSYNDRMRATIEQQGQPSKWITLRAMTALKRFRA